MKDFAARLYHLVERLTHWVWFLAPTFTRAIVGITFVYTGYGKVHTYHQNLVDLMISNHVPFPEVNAWVVGYLEWIGAYLILFGLLIRPVAFALMVTMIVAVFTSDWSDFIGSWGPTGEKGPADIASFVLFCYLLWLVMFGAGPLSVDYILGRFFRRWAGIEQKPDKD